VDAGLRDRSGSERLGFRVTSLGGARRSRQRTGAKERPFRARDAGKAPGSVGLAHETPGQTLQFTAPVHDAYVRLVASPGRERRDEQIWDDQGHFFAAAAEAMRRILVENARCKQSEKHGAGLTRQHLDAERVAAPEVREDVLALDESLTKFDAVQHQAAQLLQLRYFTGLSIPDAARALGVSPWTADRLWAYTRAWPHPEIAGDTPENDLGKN
jgi:RNA polymerase sigma factor (TIGR02999 family)